MGAAPDEVPPEIEADSDDDFSLATLKSSATTGHPVGAVSAPLEVPHPEIEADSDDDFSLAALKSSATTDHLVEECARSVTPAPKRALPKDQSHLSPPEKVAKKVQNKKLTKDEMESRVLEYMKQQNRPYNVQNVFDNLHAIIPRTQVQVALDVLSTSGALVMKEFGKNKVYLAKQDLMDDDSEEQSKTLQKDVEECIAKVQEERSILDGLKRQLSGLRAQHQLHADVSDLKREHTQLEQRLTAARLTAKAAGMQVDEGSVERVEAEHVKFNAEWRRRKRLCMDVLHQLSEATGASVGALVESYGVDTDEACGDVVL